MLSSLSIRNYALIKSLDITFRKGLNIMTGETGAGKSIILGAFGLAMGDRANPDFLISKNEKCLVESAFFPESDGLLRKYFDKNDLPWEEQLILRREILPSGKSRAFVNDTPVALATLAFIAAGLVNFTSQNEKQTLFSSDEQLDMLDSFSGILPLRNHCSEVFSAVLSLRNRIELKKQEQKDQQQNLDFLSYQLRELMDADLKEGEMEAAEKEFHLLENSKQISEIISSLKQILYEDDHSVYEKISTPLAALEKFLSCHSGIAGIYSEMQTLRYSVQEISSRLSTILNSIEHDPNRLEKLKDRIDTYYTLLKKFKAKDPEDLIEIREKLLIRIEGISRSEDSVAALEKDLKEKEKELKGISEDLTAKRKQHIPVLCRKVSQFLKEVGIEHPVFMIETTKKEFPGHNGFDEISFLLSANKGIPPSSLAKIVSGGELSRILLAVKAAFADKFRTQTLIFDEIDTGISGEIALKVGHVLEVLAQTSQVICITHLPQIASRGKLHYKIYKEVQDGQTCTQIIALSEKERVKEIAKLISGEKLAPAAQKTAKELINQNT